MTPRKDLRPATLALHAGFHPDPRTGAPTPVYKASAFAFSSVDEMAETFAGKRERWIYSRYGNPSVSEAEERVAALEGAEGAVAFASGMAAITAAIHAVMKAGDHLVAQRDLYGGTSRLLERLLPRMGMAVTFVSSEEVEQPLRFAVPATRAVFVETPTNPTLRVADLEAVCRDARERGLAVLADNTFATPINQRPLRHGATLSIQSATKYLAGHGDLVAGIAAGSGEVLRRMRDLRIEMGGCLDPEAGWLLARSLKTLPLRVRAQNENAARVAAWLASHPKVASVNYPGLPSHPRHEAARRQMSGFGGMLSFELKGGAEAARRFAEGLTFVKILPTLGGVETSLLIPAVSSHSMISEEGRRLAGVSDGLVRLSVGIEDPEDLLEELEGGLERA